jgi:hypothetical protein
MEAIIIRGSTMTTSRRNGPRLPNLDTCDLAQTAVTELRNGTTAVEPWSRDAIGFHVAEFEEPQWGHRRRAVESRPTRTCALETQAAIGHSCRAVERD